MYRIVCLILLFISLPGIHAQFSGGGEANPDLVTHQGSLEDFREMRFGMFIHWGPVTLRGKEISWSRGREIPREEYDRLYLEFDPAAFDAKEWVGLARAAGMKYIIITSRHHDGFSLWDSRFSDYDMAATPYGKGVLKELAEECKRQGIRFGTYYSICDWYHPDYPGSYPDTDDRPAEEKRNDPSAKAKMERYISFMKNQLGELVNDYNTFLVWFDGEWEWPWTHEMGMDLYAYMRELKADILINNRVDKGRAGMGDLDRDPGFAGDFATPEQRIGNFDNRFAWETCMTIGTQWAWKPEDRIKSTRECIHTLLQTIGGDGNLLFNVGPMPDGRIEERQADRLKEMGDWIAGNAEAVFGTRGGPFLPTEKMVSTHKGQKIYLYLLEHPGGKIALPLERGTGINNVYFLYDHVPLEFERNGDGVILSLPGTLPDKVATVIVLELDRPASEIPLTELKQKP